MVSGKDWWNRNVFSCRRKEERDGADRMSLGRMFQKVEAATENERWPTVDRRYGGTSSCCVNEIKGYSYSLSHSRTLWWRVRWLKQCRLEVAAELQQWWRRTCDGVWRGAGLKIHDRNMTDHKLWHERRTDVSRKLQLKTFLGMNIKELITVNIWRINGLQIMQSVCYLRCQRLRACEDILR